MGVDGPAGCIDGSLARGAAQPNRVYQVSTAETQLVYTVGEDGRLIFRYYGPRLSNPDQLPGWAMGD